jgi:hypothetical protein
MKRYLLARGLRPRTDFTKVVGIEKPKTLTQLLAKVEPYIQYERSRRWPTLSDSLEARKPNLDKRQIILLVSLGREKGAEKEVTKPEDNSAYLRFTLPLTFPENTSLPNATIQSSRKGILNSPSKCQPSLVRIKLSRAGTTELTVSKNASI